MNHDALDRLLSQPEVQAVRALARVPTILVGGAVRDALLGRSAVHDLDFAVQGNALSLGRAVANAIKGDFYVLDATRGTARVLLPTRPDRPALIMDFAACRGPDWRSDALARDFTINTLAVSLEQGTLLDETGGLADLRAGVIRAVTPQAIEDDPVRALRAVRLACALDMRIAPDTADLVRAGSALLSRPSVERLRDELMAILALDNAARATQMLDSFGLLSPLLPEIEPLRTCPLARDPQTSILQHTWRVMAALDDLLDDMRVVLAGGDYALPHAEKLAKHFARPLADGRPRAATCRLAALLHDCGKPAVRTVDAEGHVYFSGYEFAGAAWAGQRARALRLSNAEVLRTETIIRHHTAVPRMAYEFYPPAPRAIYRFFNAAGDCAPELVALALADCLDERSPDECALVAEVVRLLLDEYYARYESSVTPPTLINGFDLLAIGAHQGRLLGDVLEAVREAQMTGQIATREEALALAQRLINQHRREPLL
jgi:tRNA nucleotidyltransferase/poly(A) polymerase